MSTIVTSLGLDRIAQLPSHPRRCVYWEIDPSLVSDLDDITDPVFEKEAWISTVLLQWGSCGQIALVDGKSAGCALYAPPASVPRARLFPTAPASPDAVLLTTLFTEPRYRGADIEQRLVQAVVTDLVRRGARALEAFGLRGGPACTSLTDRGAGGLQLLQRIGVPQARGGGRRAETRCAPDTCMIDADFLQEVGFRVIAPHHRYPRLRLDIDSDHGWKEDVEHALDQLLAAASLPSATRMATL